MGKPKVYKHPDVWAQELTAEQFKVTRLCGTETPFDNPFWNHKAKGTYLCVCCKAILFDSESKFDSGTGWPSFSAPNGESAVTKIVDCSHGMRRLEVRCAQCAAHLGHIFKDGPEPTRNRYCINSAALVFVPSTA